VKLTVNYGEYAHTCHIGVTVKLCNNNLCNNAGYV